MQKGVIKVIVKFCAERTKAAAVGECKYVTLNISSSSRRMSSTAHRGKNPVGCFSPGCPLATAEGA